MLYREIIAVCSQIRSSYDWYYRVLLGLPVFVSFVYVMFVTWLFMYFPQESVRLYSTCYCSTSLRCVSQPSTDVVPLSW